MDKGRDIHIYMKDLIYQRNRLISTLTRRRGISFIRMNGRKIAVYYTDY